MTFYWYTENTGSDLDTIVLSGSTGNSNNYDTGETRSLNDFLEAEGHHVIREERADGPGDVSGFDLVIVARETNSPDYDDVNEEVNWNALSLPLINLSPQLMRNNRWGWVNGTSLLTIPFSSYDSPFADPSHPIVLGATSSMLSPSLSAARVSNSLPTGTKQIATMVGRGGSWHLRHPCGHHVTQWNGKHRE